MSVFVLENGSYSDTHIVGIFSTRELAEIAAQIFTDDPNVTEWDIDAQAEEMRLGARPYFVRLNRDTGDTLECDLSTSSYGAFSKEMGRDVNQNLYAYCWAMDREHAIKIAGDRRRVFLASERTS